MSRFHSPFWVGQPFQADERPTVRQESLTYVIPVRLPLRRERRDAFCFLEDLFQLGAERIELRVAFEGLLNQRPHVELKNAPVMGLPKGSGGIAFWAF